MEKEKVLVRDNKGIFLKMFKRRFKDEFDFSEELFLIENKNESKKFDRSIFVVYDKTELLDYFKFDKEGANVLVCLFNKQLLSSLSFLEEIKNLIVLDDTKTRPEIIKELKLYFENNLKFSSRNKQELFSNTSIFQTQFQDYYKALFFLM
ncbi:hypothetical protein [Flavobacterium sp. KACC 22761]|uniref:hypothetical protein n=1 Tax=Flavobacterium sp. KACC 22761 TaxID=3092665 RepID=UPI002A753AA9|nr:hypothetical protein [Flavobacterium sp. KACC 22761]WPO78467.1 hypothetical protein SCB73_19590 [Flavobacterium sp. KACC 22761]